MTTIINDTSPSILNSIGDGNSNGRSNHNKEYRYLNLNFLLIYVAAPCYICYRIYVVQHIPMMDCDEIYNYWEPLHYMLYGSGFQTWEYHYSYALRTYSYLVPLQFIAKVLIAAASTTGSTGSASTNKTVLFLLLRQSIATVTACCELFFIYALLQYYSRTNDASSSSSSSSRSTGSHQSKHPLKGQSSSSSSSQQLSIIKVKIQEATPSTDTCTIPYCTAILLLTCTGMNHSGSALLPSATWISIWCLCSGCFLLSYHTFFVGMAIVGTLTTGWPFGCICVVPMALHISYKEFFISKRPLTFLGKIIFTTIIVQSIVTYIDTMYYGTITFPTYNIFRYNAGESNDTLYGVEPITYYIKNLFLNCNFMALFGCMTIPIYLLLLLLLPVCTTGLSNSSSNSIPSQPQQNEQPMNFDFNILSILLSLPIWFFITLPRPHKEERFMYPIYPVLVYGSALTIDILLSFFLRKIILPLTRHQPSSSSPSSSVSSTSTSSDRTRYHTKFIRWKWIGHMFVWMPVVTISMSRTYALHKYYHAPLDIYNYLSSTIVATTTAATTATEKGKQYRTTDMVCTCGEWYRYPSSFYLPDIVSIPVGFLPSSFTGQLPQPFTAYGSKVESLNHVQPFNDRNIEEKDRYVKDILQCSYLIDVSDSNDCRSQFNTAESVTISNMYSIQFLDADHSTSILHRALYIPFYHEYSHRNGQVAYKNYTLYRIKT